MTTAVEPTKNDAITAPDMVADKLPQTVEIKDVGPCKKHVKVTINEAAVKARYDEKYSDLVLKGTGFVPGFRTGKVPRKIVEKRYKSEVEQEIRQELLMASLEQLADEQAISPLSPPELDPRGIVVPEQGDFVYEFDIEVRPEFNLPNYKGLTIRRPTHTFTDEDVAEGRRRLLSQFVPPVPKDGAADLDDIIVCEGKVSHKGNQINTLPLTRFKVETKLALEDGVCENFAEKVVGVKAGETRTIQIVLSTQLVNADLRGETVDCELTVKEILQQKAAELTPELMTMLGINEADQFNELVRVRLERQLEYHQRQVARNQMFELLAKDTNWELPQDMLQRQARKTLARRIMEMREAGMSDEQIRGRRKVLENDALRSTANALKEHFVLQKISEVEKLEIDDQDIELEIDAMAQRSGESYRKVRARLEKEDLIEALATELLERKALDLVLENATYSDYDFNPLHDKESDVATSTASMTPDQPANG